MKKIAFILFNLLLSTLLAHAGNMFGPGPFRNGSPLVSGVDGTYQATARAENITGIFRFAYSGGSQTIDYNQNSWVFFREGRVLRGEVDTNINESSIAGVLSTATPRATNNQNALPLIITSRDDAAAGSFTGTLNLKSPNGAFSGSGIFQTAATYTETYTIITTNGAGNIDHAAVPVTMGGGANDFTNSFNFRGVRTSVSAESTTNTAN